MKKILLLSIIICCCLFLVGCNQSEDSPEEVKEKAVQEIDYCSFKLTNILNSLNNISIEAYIVSSKESELTEGAANSKSSSSGTQGSQGGQGASSQGGSSSAQSGEPSSSGNDKASQGNGTANNTTINTTQMIPNSVILQGETTVDWSDIALQIELINSAWGIVMVDLYDLNVPSEEILGFTDKLNESIINIKEQNKVNTIKSISELYAYLPKFLSYISAENNRKNIYQTQSYVLNAYALIEQDDWTGISNNLVSAETAFVSVVNDLEYIKNREYKVNRTYLAIKDLQNCIGSQDRKLFYLKYKNLMQSINTL